MGPWLANFIANYATKQASIVATAMLLMLAGAVWLAFWHWQQRRQGKTGVENWQILLAGLAGTWLCLSVTIVAAAYWLVQSRGSVAGAGDEGPLRWVYSFAMEGGGSSNVFSLRFTGANTSKQPVELQKAELISLIDGSRLAVEVMATDDKGDQKIVSVDRIHLIPPGAPIQLVAKFGPPNPDHPGMILGLDPRTFLEKWRQFSFNAKDDTRSYQLEFNETAMMPFFQGKVGPRISIKQP
jgi:hypothetical protein